MDFPRKVAASFTITEVVVLILVLGVLVFLAVPGAPKGLSRPEMMQELVHARSLGLTSAAMAFDGLNTKGDHVVWTSMVTGGKSRPATLAEFFGALTNDANGGAYLSESDLRKLLAIDGRPPRGPLTEGNIAFRFFWVEESSPPGQPFLVTANWRHGRLTRNPPPGRKGCVYFTKGGSASVKRASRDGDRMDVFPDGSEGNPAYHRETLK